MPNKKGSKVAASKARAQAMAKKKARHAGPVLAAAAYVPPPPVDEEATAESDGAIDEAAPAATSAPASVAIAPPAAQAPPARAPRGFSRERAHQTPPALSVSLRREVGLIGVLTVVVVGVLVALRLFTDLGG